ncbi:MAG: translation elongation factor 4 [Pseudomonadota bacterium]
MNIRNFAIIAHIDHGKSTLADRLIQQCGGLQERDMRKQVLDSMDLERERGITIKAQTVRLAYQAQNGQDYQLNLMDTPGHVDFAYEVSRCMAACEGSILVVDATQGVEAQTLANVYQAIDAGHEIIPVINKIDLPASDPAAVKKQIQDVIGLSGDDAIDVSAKTGQGIDELLEALVARLPPPQESDPDAPLQALLIDSRYDAYLGVVMLVRIRQGTLRRGGKIRFASTKAVHTVEKVGYTTPKPVAIDALYPGEVGFIVAGIKDIGQTLIGDTLTDDLKTPPPPLAGFRRSEPVVYCGLFPVDSGDLGRLRNALGRLSLNDTGLRWEPEKSTALGHGFRLGCLGLLHLEVIQERLIREFDIDLFTAAPSVLYRVHGRGGSVRPVHNPADLPDPTQIEKIEEPWLTATIISPADHVGGIITLCQDRRGVQKDIAYSGTRAVIRYDLPLNEVIYDFYDQLKSLSHGYASLDYQVDAYREGDLVKMTILVNHEPVDALANIVHRRGAQRLGRQVCERLVDLIPRQLYKIAVQAAIGGKIIARETVSAMRKDVTAKCYGGDVTRKRKLLEKQKAGKKRMMRHGKVEIPQNAFIEVLRHQDS